MKRKLNPQTSKKKILPKGDAKANGGFTKSAYDTIQNLATLEVKRNCSKRNIDTQSRIVGVAVINVGVERRRFWNCITRLYDRLISYSGFEAEIIREGLLDLIQEAIPELEQSSTQNPEKLASIIQFIQTFEDLIL